MEKFLDLVKNDKDSSLAGKFLIASPYALLNKVFDKSLIYLVAHDKNGAVGLMVNCMINTLSFNTLLKSVGGINIKDNLAVNIFMGGPSEPERGFVLHSNEYKNKPLCETPEDLAVSSNVEILNDIALGKGPQEKMLIMGYSIWQPYQLEFEVSENYWIVSESNKNIIFQEKGPSKWENALNLAGVSDYNFFTSNIGHA